MRRNGSLIVTLGLLLGTMSLVLLANPGQLQQSKHRATSSGEETHPVTGIGTGDSIPSVVVTVRNMGGSRGALLTPPWVGIHDGTFDSYNTGKPASSPLGGDEIERLAEDGNTGPISATFDTLSSGAPQATVVGPGGPLAPGDRASITLNVDPANDRFFSYATMIIPSNDAFVANGDPVAHPLFNMSGEFIGRGFIVSGDESNDAGTEVNDELAGNVAFLNQSAPNTGDDEGGVVAAHGGYDDPGTHNYPDGVLNHPAFGNAQFNAAGTRLLGVRFEYVDLGGTVPFSSVLNPAQQIQGEPVVSAGRGEASLESRLADELEVMVDFDGLSGPVLAAHLHLGQVGVNGPVVLNLADGIGENSIDLLAKADDLSGPLAGQELIALLNELAAGNVYINLHTQTYPGGEIRGQVLLGNRDDGGNGPDCPDDEDDDDSSDDDSSDDHGSHRR